MRNPKNWKHTTKNHKAYGNWDGSKYLTPFIIFDVDEDEEGNEEDGLQR